LRKARALHALDRDAAAVAAKIVHAVDKPTQPGRAARYTGPSLSFTVASIDGR